MDSREHDPDDASPPVLTLVTHTSLHRVTRLIKASKQQKPARDSVLSGSPSGSVLSITKPEVQVGQKLSAAQSELQACEAHLASKEQELNVFRTHTIKSGLQARCRVMAECGWAWGEMGKEGIRALDTLGMENGYGTSRKYAVQQTSFYPRWRELPDDSVSAVIFSVYVPNRD